MRRLVLVISSLLFIYLAGFVLLILVQEKFIFLDEELPADYQFTFDQPFEEVNLTSDLGEGKLNALWFKVENTKGLILYFHGNRGNLTRWGAIAGSLTQYGYDVLVMDYRGFGKSTGKRNQKSIMADAVQFYEWAEEEYGEEHVILFGRSLGTGLASYLAGRYNPKQLILETPYYSLAKAAQRYYPIYPSKLALRYNFKSFQYLKEATCPITIFHGTDDLVVPYEQGVELAESLQGKKVELITIEGGEHRNLSDFPDYHISLQKTLSD